MPKLKTNRGAAKRFRKTGGGGFKSGHAYVRHILTKLDVANRTVAVLVAERLGILGDSLLEI